MVVFWMSWMRHADDAATDSPNDFEDNATCPPIFFL